MFLPQELHDWVATRQIRDSSGTMRPLVISDRVLFQSSRPPDPQAPPGFGWLWIVGGVIGAMFIGLGVLAEDSRVVTRAAAAVFGIWAAVSGIVGLLVSALWAFTDHKFAYANENLLLFHPLWLIVAVTLPMLLLGGRGRRLTEGLLAAFVSLAGIGLLLHLVGLSRQSNMAIIGLALLPALGLLIVVRRWRTPN
jgi:hypothetical protein